MNFPQINFELIDKLRCEGEQAGCHAGTRDFNKFCATPRSDKEKVRWLVNELDGLYDLVDMFERNLGSSSENLSSDGFSKSMTGIAKYESENDEQTAHPKYKDEYWFDNSFVLGKHSYLSGEYRDYRKAVLAIGGSEKEMPLPIYLGGREMHKAYDEKDIAQNAYTSIGSIQTMDDYTIESSGPLKKDNLSGIVLYFNCNKNVVADFFYQLKFELVNKDGKPYLENSSEDIAIFLQKNVSCFLNTKLNTIKDLLNSGKKENRPQKADQKLTIVKGFVK